MLFQFVVKHRRRRQGYFSLFLNIGDVDKVISVCC